MTWPLSSTPKPSASLRSLQGMALSSGSGDSLGPAGRRDEEAVAIPIDDRLDVQRTAGLRIEPAAVADVRRIGRLPGSLDQHRAARRPVIRRDRERRAADLGEANAATLDDARVEWQLVA